MRIHRHVDGSAHAPAGVIVTDVQTRAMLAAVRCLDAAGYRVAGVGPTPLAPGLWSRAVRERHVLADPLEDSRAFLDGLERLAVEGGQSLLMAGTDASLLAISQHRRRFEPHLALGLPAREAVERALDKRALDECARAAGLEQPPARICDDVEQALAAAAELGYPVLVKPLHAALERGGRIVRFASRLAGDVEALQAACAELGPCIVQQRLEGAMQAVAGVLGETELLGAVRFRYKRIWPPEAGSACFAETIPLPDGLADALAGIVAALGWRGLFQLELIERPGGGLAAVDLNPRAFGSLGIARAAGVPLTAIWARSTLGERAPVTRARVGVRFRWVDADLRHASWQLRRGRARAAAAALRPRPRVAHAYLRIADPAPALARTLELGLAFMRRSLDRRAGGVAPPPPGRQPTQRLPSKV